MITFRKLRESLEPFYIVCPFLVLWLVFIFLPGFLNIGLSLFKTNLFVWKFVGLQNYKRLISDPLFWRALANSVKYLIVVPFLQLASLTLAVGIYKFRRFGRTLMVIYYLPVITSVVVLGALFKYIFADYGLLNSVLSTFLSFKVGWLSDPRLALYSVMFVTFIKGLGYYTVIYYSSLLGLPKDVLESAYLDGANGTTLLFKFIVPMIAPTVLFCTLISTLSALKVFGEVYVMTDGGPAGSTTTLMFYIYKRGFCELELGYSATLSVVLTLVSLLLSSLLFRMYYSKKYSF